MSNIRSANLTDENEKYLQDHQEITFTGLVNKLINEYRATEAQKNV